MGWNNLSESVCQIACSLAVVGDRWTLLIMRELSMGINRFDELQAQTGMSSHLLSTRLKRMEKDGLIEQRAYSEKPRRHEYLATKKGKELDAVLLALRAWGLRWKLSSLGEEPCIDMHYKATGENMDAAWQIPSGGPPFTFDDIDASLHPAFIEERAAKSAAFQARKKKTAAGT